MSSQTIITGFDPKGPFAGMILPPAFRKRQKETRFKQEWRLTIAQYLALMRVFKGPRKQRGSFYAGVIATSPKPSGVASVVLNAHFFNSDGFSGTITSGVEFQNDGELYEIDSEFGNVQQNGEWWSNEPQASIGNSYEARHLSSGKTGTYSSEAAAANVWITLTSNRQWNVQRSASGTKSCTATFEVGLDGVESALDSAIITVAANFEA